MSMKKLWVVGLLQATGVLSYCGLITLLMSRGNQIFGKVPDYFGPLLFLTLFSTSALICALITFYYPFMLFFQKKQATVAVKVVLYTAGWLLLFTLTLLGYLIIF